MENEKTFHNQGSEMLPNLGIQTHPNEPNCQRFPSRYFSQDWDNSVDQGDPFESALSSMVSSPATNGGGGGDGVVLRELIGRLGNICNPGEFELSPHSYNNSCYNTPLSSPPKLNLSVAGHCQQGIPSDPRLAAFSAGPAVVEMAARYSCLGAWDNEPKLPSRTAPAIRDRKLGKSPGCSSQGGGEESSVSEQIPAGNVQMKARAEGSTKKRKGKETTLPSPAKTDPKVAGYSDESNGKRRKPNGSSGNKKEGGGGPKPGTTTAAAEPPKDYIHVRAGRGQATDSHSLAERVRREKISERMKFLQDLVPGCNKVVGKAVMLDEIINYVQSLQRQVEFLSMKLATMNPRMEFNAEALLSKDIFQSQGSIAHNMYPLDTTIPFAYQSPQGFSMLPLNSVPPRNPSPQSADVFSEALSQASAFWGDDLHSVVQMGFGRNQPHNFEAGTGQMKLSND